MSKILITGAGGFLGTELVDFLLKFTEHNIVGVVKKNTGFLNESILNHKRFQLRKDILSDDISSYFDRTDEDNIIVHLASQQPKNANLTFEDYYSANVLTTLKLLQLYKSVNIKTFIYISSINVIGENLVKEKIDESITPKPATYYELTKFLSEKILGIEHKNHKTKILVIRYPSIVGKNHLGGLVYTYYNLIKENKEIEIYSNGNQYRNLIHASDAVKTIIKTIENHHKFVNYEIIHSGAKESLTTFEIASLIKEKLNSSSKLIRSDQITNHSWNLFLDLSKLKNKLNFEPLDTKEVILKYLRERA